MSASNIPVSRYIGLDVHKHYLVAYGVDRDQNRLYGPRRVDYSELERWIAKDLTPTDAVALEMTTNTWTLVDILEPQVHSVIVVHPPEVKAIVKARVMTDKKAARVLAQLHAAGLLPAVWVPPKEVRELRSLVAGRRRMVSMATRAKNTLHAVLHTHQIFPPEEFKDIFHPKVRQWWEELPLTALEMTRVLSELDTLHFATTQKERFEDTLGVLAAQDDRVPLLVQLPGIGIIGAMTILGAIGTVERFPSSQKLVGYAGLGARVHVSGKSSWSGRITKSGRRDLRKAMVDAAHHAVKANGHWKAQFQRLEKRIGRPKALVAIGRKLLVAVWHVLTKAEADKYAEEGKVSAAFFRMAYEVGVGNLPGGVGSRQFVRDRLDELGIGQDLTHIPWGKKRYTLPPSKLATDS
jgi:transposase